MEQSEIVKSQRLKQYRGQEIPSYCDSVRLNKVVNNIDKAVRGNFNNSLCFIESIELGLIARSSNGVSISLVKSIYKATVKTLHEDDNLFLEDESVKLIEKEFLSVYKAMLKDDKRNAWNKARFIIFNNSHCLPILKFKYDSDLEWVESLDVNSFEYNELSADVEAKINQWDGLPKNFPRMWMH